MQIKMQIYANKFARLQMNQTLSEAGLFDPQEYAVSVAATFGYKVKDIAKKARKPLADIVTWAK